MFPYFTEPCFLDKHLKYTSRITDFDQFGQAALWTWLIGRKGEHSSCYPEMWGKSQIYNMIFVNPIMP